MEMRVTSGVLIAIQYSSISISRPVFAHTEVFVLYAELAWAVTAKLTLKVKPAKV